MGFEARYRGFVVVQGVSLPNERVLGPPRLRHALYSFLATLWLRRGLTSGSAQALGLATAVGLLTVFSALYPRRSMGLEAYLLALLASLLDVATGSREGRRTVRETGGRPAPAKKPAPARAVGRRAVLYAGLLATGSGALPVVYGVLLRSAFLVVAGGFPMGVGLALALGRRWGRPS